MRLLRTYLSSETLAEEGLDSPQAFVVANLPKKAEVLAAFDKALESAPENPLYWQAKGDVLGKGDASEEAYRKAIALKPRNASELWYLLYIRAAAENTSEKPHEEWAAALEVLTRAKARDRGNAWPLYEEAYIHFRYAPYSRTGASGNRDAPEAEKERLRQAVRNDEARKNGRRAVELVLEGNSAPRFETPRYRDSVPDLLAAAWRYRFMPDVDFLGFARIRELARAIASYAQFMAEYENKPEEAERAAWSVVGLGNRWVNDWPERDDFSTGRTRIQAIVGAAVVGIGFQYLEKVYTTLGNTEKRTAVEAQRTAFKQRADEYNKTLQNSLRASDLDYY